MVVVCPEIAQIGLIGIPSCVLIRISYDSMYLGCFQRLFRVESNSECDSAPVGDHFEELFMSKSLIFSVT
jgi:hypothetical protein